MNFTDIKDIDDLEKIYPKHILDKFPKANRGRYANVPDKDWYSWHWQLNNRIETIEQLSKIINLTDNEKEAFNQGISLFKMSITPYYASLMDIDDPKCPIRMQSVPAKGELTVLETELEDPLGEEKMMPVPGLTHRYPDRVLFYVSHDCAMLCRHCTRKRKVANPSSATIQKHVEEGLNYIRNNNKIHDVIVSGGDPLHLSNEKLDYILGELRKIEHIQVVRLGTRNPVTMPIRFRDDELLKIIEKHQPIHLNTHFNHPKEMTRETLLACTRISLAGADLGNQSVLLKGINDSAEVMTKLCRHLLLMKIRPYYIFQCDLAEGISHFRTSIKKGVEIIRKMRGWISGLAIPQYVVDAPGGGGKVPMNPDYFVSRDGNKVTLRNYENNEFDYYEVED